MIRNLETLEKIFKLVKYIKKPLVKIYPDGRIMYWLEGYPNNFEDMLSKGAVKIADL